MGRTVGVADVSIENGVLRIDLTVPERVLSLHGRTVEIPIGNITDMRPVEDVMSEIRGLKMPGTRLPGSLAIGTWQGQDDREAFHDFVVVHEDGPGVVISAQDSEYDRVVLGNEDPDALLAELSA